MRSTNFWLLSLLTVLPLANPAAAKGYTDRQAVRFDLYRDYLVVAQGSAGPLKGLNFLLDTGASPTILDRRVAQKLRLEELPASIAVLNGSVQAGQATVPSLLFGPLQRDNLPVLVEDLSFFQKALPVHIDAVVGLDVLGQTPFQIDYLLREIRFGPLPQLANSLPLQMKGGLPIVVADLNHITLPLLVDTGASALILFEPSTPRPMLPLKISSTPNTIGEAEHKQVWLHNLNLGETRFSQERALVVKSGPEGNHDFEGLMSPAALGITRLAIDLNRGLLTFTR